MLIHVLPGPVHGPPLALPNELNLRHLLYRLTGIVDADDDTEATGVLQKWPTQKSLPTVLNRTPNIPVVPVHPNPDPPEADSRYVFSKKDSCSRTLANLDCPKGPLRDLLHLLSNPKTVWVNTNHPDYLRPQP